MIPVTAEPLCRTPGCPAPSSPDWHIPWCQDIPGHKCFGAATHQHAPKRSQGGKAIVACLCAGAHDRIDNGPGVWGNAVRVLAEGRTYFAWDGATDGKPHIVIERVIDPPWWEDGAGQTTGAARPVNSLSLISPALPSEEGSAGPEESFAPPASGLALDFAGPEDNLPTSGPAYTATALVLPLGMAFEEWAGLGRSLQQMGRSVRWWVGDWLAYGEKHYGQTYTQAVEATGRKNQDLMNMNWVSSQVEISRRRDTLSWSHHAEVAALPPAEQDAFLAQAEAEGLTVAGLRQAIRPTIEPETCTCSSCGNVHRRRIL
mgnify:CR=1 FL=1